MAVFGLGGIVSMPQRIFTVCTQCRDEKLCIALWSFLKGRYSGARGPPQLSKKGSENACTIENLSCGFPINSGNRSGSCSENFCSRITRSHSENGILHSESYFLNSESCSENAQESSQSSENGLFTSRAFFLKSGWSPDF